MISTTTRASTGHFTMFQIVVAVSPRPRALPTASATGPETTSRTAATTTRTMAMTVTSS